MEFRILGPLEVSAGGRALNLGGLRQRRILAALLLNPNRAVPLSRLVAAAWDDDDQPATADQQVRNRVAALRRVLTRAGALIDTEDSGYRLRVGPGELDLASFESLADQGFATADASTLRRALALWRGPALAGLGGETLARDAARLDEHRLAVWERCLELELAAGTHDAVVAEVENLVTAHPLRERLVGLWMTALYRCGRRGEALTAYQALADRLAEELGLDPSPDLRRLRERMQADGAGAVVPAQLPHSVVGFTGRVSELAQLDALLADGQLGRTVVISAIAGTAGVGKTALAVHWAHRVRDKFPDGQLYVNLRGFDPSGVVKPAADAVRGFLDALGVPTQRIPTDPDEMVALYRDLLADKRMLVVLDNARDAEHVRPLLPGASACLVLVTSRSQLTRLVNDGGGLIALDVLTEDEARQLLAHRLGADRVAAEPGAADEIVARCARLPLALAIVAARAVLDDRSSLAALAEQLNGVRAGLSAFASDDPRSDVRAVFSWSYQILSTGAGRLFRLLGLHPGPDLTAPAAASLVGAPPDQISPLLAELVRAHLIVEHRPGRLAVHDLLRVYAAELVQTVDAEDQRQEALGRMFDHYLRASDAAAALLTPHRDRRPLPRPQQGVALVAGNSEEWALAWFSHEHAVLLAAIQHAIVHGFDAYVWQQAFAFATFLDRRGYWHDWITIQTAAIAATRRLGDQQGQARINRSLGLAYARLQRPHEAHDHLQHALELFEILGDTIGQAHTHHSFAFVFAREDRHGQALQHALAALRLYETSGDQAGKARALNAVGWSYTQLGNHEQALDYCNHALGLLQQLGDRHNEAETWDSLGHAHHNLVENDKAIVCYQRALALFQELGNRRGEAEAAARLGDTFAAIGNYSDGRSAWKQALAIYEDLDHPDAATVRAKLAAP